MADLLILSQQWLQDMNEVVTEFEANPVIVRDRFNESCYHVFIPGDHEGNYWSRWTLVWPTDSNKNLYPIKEVFWGIVRPGKTQTYEDVSASNGSWFNATVDGWHFGRATVSGSWLEWDIPDFHNRIHVLLLWTNGYSASLDVSINGSYDELDYAWLDPVWPGYEEVVVASNSIEVGRKLRLTAVGPGYTEIIGIHSFNDNEVGSPSTAANNLAVGHDLVDVFGYTYGSWISISELYGSARKLMKSNTVELTANWAPDAQSLGKWTAYGAHYGSNNAEFVPYAPTKLFIDNADVGYMDDRNNFNMGQLVEAYEISTTVEGYGDYNFNGVQDEEDVFVTRILTSFTKTGVNISSTVKWDGEGVMNYLYAPSLPINDRISGYICLPPDKKKFTIGSDYSGLGGNELDLYPDNINCKIKAKVFGPVKEVHEKSDIMGGNKIYFKIDTEFLEQQSPASKGSCWTNVSSISIRTE